MSKQTALDWYWDKMKSYFEHDGELFETASFTFAIAKEKEREQAREHYIAGFSERDDINSKLFFNPLASQYNEKRFDEYYNETYGADK